MTVGTLGPVAQTIDMELQLSASLNCWNDLKHYIKVLDVLISLVISFSLFGPACFLSSSSLSLF
jgi:hypothetical protein